MLYTRLALSIGAAAVALLSAVGAHAAPITSLYSTGLKADGTVQVAAGADAHYTVVSTGNAAEVRSPLPGSYFPNDSDSQWIWARADGTPVNTTLTFRTTFDLTGFDAATAVINGLWGTDNTGLDILLNGVSTGISLPGSSISNFQVLHAFTISSGFIAGVNTLDFVIQDVGSVGAFRADLSGTAAAVPEPATLAIVGLGLLGVGLSRRRA